MTALLSQMKQATIGENHNSNGDSNCHSNGVATRNYMKWDAPGVESIPPNEAEDIQAVADMINKIQHAQFNCHRHMYGGKLYTSSSKNFETYSKQALMPGPKVS